MKEELSANQRHNGDSRVREYLGDFHSPFLKPDQKHTFEVFVKVDGTVCIKLNFVLFNQQSSHAIMLTNEQRVNLAEFLTIEEPVLWVDKEIGNY